MFSCWITSRYSLSMISKSLNCRSDQMSLKEAARVLPLLGGVLLLVVLALAFSTSTSQSDTFSNTMTRPPFSAPWSKAKLLPREQNSNQPNILDGCHHVYLDMGSNMWDTKQRTTSISSNPRGIQIRKVYEPKLFPHAAMLPIFDKYFGSVQSRW